MPPKKLNRSDRQAENIVGSNINVNTKNRIHKYAVETVKKCINGEIYENFINYFEVNHYNKERQNQKYLFLKYLKLGLGA